MIYQLKHGLTTNKKILVITKHKFGKTSKTITRLMFQAHRVKYHQSVMYTMANVIELFDTTWLEVANLLIDTKKLKPITPTSLFNQSILGLPLVWSVQIPNSNNYLLINDNLNIAVLVQLNKE